MPLDYGPIVKRFPPVGDLALVGSDPSRTDGESRIVFPARYCTPILWRGTNDSIFCLLRRSTIRSGNEIRQVVNNFVFKEQAFDSYGDLLFLWDDVAVPVHCDNDRAPERALMQRRLTEVINDYPAQSRVAWRRLEKSASSKTPTSSRFSR